MTHTLELGRRNDPLGFAFRARENLRIIEECLADKGEGHVVTQVVQSLLAFIVFPRVSDEHFSVDGTLIEAWASQKGLRPKDGSGDDDEGANLTQNQAVTKTGKTRNSAIDERTPRHPGYGMSRSRRAMVECIFGWGKQHGTMRKTKHRGIARVAADFLLNLIAYNLIRIPKLLAA